MSKNEEVDVTDFLTDGSVWKRKKGKLKGQEVKLLFLTNLPLIDTSAAEEHPVRIVYANAKGEVFDRTVDEFCSVYGFHHVDGKLEARLNKLLAFDEPEDDEDEDEDEQAADDQDGEDDDSDAIDAAFGGAPATAKVSKPVGTLAQAIYEDLSRDDAQDEHEQNSNVGLNFVLSDVPSYTKPALTAEDLSRNLVSYVQEPAWSHGLLAHRLIFRLDDKVTMASLREVFEPSSAVDTVSSFSGIVAGEPIYVPWTTWIGVFPEAFNGAHYAAVHVGTEYTGNQETEGDAEEEGHPTDDGPAVAGAAQAGENDPAPVAAAQPEAEVPEANADGVSAEVAPNAVQQPEPVVQTEAAPIAANVQAQAAAPTVVPVTVQAAVQQAAQ